jgi:hypothetical protein
MLRVFDPGTDALLTMLNVPTSVRVPVTAPGLFEVENPPRMLKSPKVPPNESVPEELELEATVVQAPPFSAT